MAARTILVTVMDLSFSSDLQSYRRAAPNPPVLQEAQIPAPLELPIMFLQRFVRLASSPALSVDGVNAVSVTEYEPVGLA
jgi:hypothetical protein